MSKIVTPRNKEIKKYNCAVENQIFKELNSKISAKKSPS